MTDQALNWGILGAASFALEHMGPAIHAAQGATLAAVASRGLRNLAAFQALVPDIRTYSGDDAYMALLSDPDIDAVYIPLPNHMHVNWTLKALAAGKYVLCEKPMTLEGREFDQLIAACDRSGLVAAEAFMILHHPQWAYTRQLIADGAIGRLARISGAFAFDSREDVNNIRHRSETGGGALRDIGVYTFGSARFVTGAEPEDISARIRWENKVDAYSDVSARFGDVEYAAYTTTRMSLFQEMTFHGEGGLIRLTAPFNPGTYREAAVELHRDGHSVAVQKYPAVNQYVLQVEAFGRAVRGEESFPVTLEFSKGTQCAIDTALKNGSSLAWTQR
ncbi:MAG: Gfo/Idh/MocA family oxidoreductase [Rhodobacteraceae bacterium]|nr:Gfo/Idh/MocA family oxidoreductase [Paracoccaceae bacterium]